MTIEPLKKWGAVCKDSRINGNVPCRRAELAAVNGDRFSAECVGEVFEERAVNAERRINAIIPALKILHPLG